MSDSESKTSTETAVHDVVLLPCPCCGGSANSGCYDEGGGDEWWVECSKCELMLGNRKSEQDARSAWNKRPNATNEKRRAERQAEYDKKAKAKTTTLQGALMDAGPIELKDAETWAECKAKNQDPYGGRCVRYAEEWGRLMQVRIANGEAVAECAEELSRLADDDGITGFMYGAAVSMLAKCWKHGEELRRWHNKETQVGTEGDEANDSGGVLNPAVLNVR